MNEKFRNFLIRQWEREFKRVNGEERKMTFERGRFCTHGQFTRRITTEEVMASIERLQQRSDFPK